MDLFNVLIVGNINADQVRKNKNEKNKNNFKSELGKIKKGNPESRSEYQISLIQNNEEILDLREKFTYFFVFRNYFLLLSEANYKAEHGRGLRISNTKQML